MRRMSQYLPILSGSGFVLTTMRILRVYIHGVTRGPMLGRDTILYHPTRRIKVRPGSGSGSHYIDSSDKIFLDNHRTVCELRLLEAKKGPKAQTLRSMK